MKKYRFESKTAIIGISVIVLFLIGVGMLIESDINIFDSPNNELKYIYSTPIVLTDDETDSTIEGIAHVFKNNTNYQITFVGHFDSGKLSNKYMQIQSNSPLIPTDPLTYSLTPIVKPSISSLQVDQTEYPNVIQLFKSIEIQNEHKYGDFMITYIETVTDSLKTPSLVLYIKSEYNEEILCDTTIKFNYI